MTNGAAPEPTADDRAAVVDLVFGHMAAQAVASAVRLGVAEHLEPSGGDPETLAARLGADTGATVRLLRALAALGVVEEPTAGVFRLTGRGTLLRGDVDRSMHAFVSMFLDPTMVQSWQYLDTSVRHGRTSFREVFGSDFFAHLAERPDLSRTFNASMRQGTARTATALPNAYDFTAVEIVADVGGGDGTLLAHLLTAFPHLRGVLFDSPEGSAQAEEVLAAAGVADRCRVQTGDFFAEAPTGADLYLLKSVIHDWDDDADAAILSHIRREIGDQGRLLLIEPVLPERVDGSLPATMYLSDLNMLVNVGGRERTERDFRALCARAGFAVSFLHHLPPPSGFSLIEAVPTGP